MYSQGNEEQIILEYFENRIARFCEIGAFDGKTFSNTFALAERGWGGVCVEPEPESLEGLRRTHEGRLDIAIVAAAVTNVDGMVQFHSSGGAGVSTTSDAHRDKWESASAFTTITVPSLTPETLLKMWHGPFAFFSLDVEGNSADLLTQFPLSNMGTELVCCEHDSRQEKVIEHCAAHGLTRVLLENAENLIIGK